MQILVIKAKDLEFNETDVIGIADSTENAEKLIKEYYGDFKEISKNIIEDSSIEYIKKIEVCFNNVEKSEAIITLEWFNLNSL